MVANDPVLRMKIYEGQQNQGRDGTMAVGVMVKTAWGCTVTVCSVCAPDARTTTRC